MQLAVSPPIASLLARRHARRSPGSRARLEALLREHDYPVRESIWAFDAAFGGLTFPDSEVGPDWELARDRGWMIGTELCLGEGGHDAPRGGDEEASLELVPVAYSPNDVIYYLDRDARGWCEDAIEGPPMPCSEDGARLVARIVLESMSWSATPRPEERPGHVAAELVATHGLTLVPDASDAYARWWLGDSGWVAEYEDSPARDACTMVWLHGSSAAR